MGLFKATPEEKAAKETERAERQAERERVKAEERKRKEAVAFAQTPAGKARAAKAAGAGIFQIDVPLSYTLAETIAMVGVDTHTFGAVNYASVIQSIEAEGWRLEHAGYIYRVTGSVSRDKFMSSGQQEAVSGAIVGIYIFRSSDV